MLMIATPDGRGSRRTRGVTLFGIMFVGIVLALSACSDPVESEEYRALESDLGATAAELESVSNRLETITAERDVLGEQVAELESELVAAEENRVELESSLATSEDRRRGLETEIDDLGAAADSAWRAAEALVTDLIFLGDDYEMLDDSGALTAVGDDVVQMLNLPGDSWADFNDGDPMFFWRSRIDGLNDEELTAAFDTWWSAPYGSDEELSAWFEIRLRLIRHLVEHLDEAAAGMNVSADA